jgi:hypothetical protein
MQWWGALTQQFTEIAAKAMKEAGLESASVPELSVSAPPPRTGAKKAPARKTAAARRTTVARKRGA